MLLAHPATGSTPFRVDTAHPLLDLSDVVSTAGEEGLLGLAFDRSGSTLYVSYDIESNDTRVGVLPHRRDERRGPRSPAATATLVLAVDQPDETNHKAATCSSGPTAPSTSGWATAATRATRTTSARTPTPG